MTSDQDKIKMFISCTSEDKTLLHELEDHLSALKREELISTWHHSSITAGAHRDQTIEEQLEQSSLILLLVSPSFFASDQNYEIEMKRALKRQQNKLARVVAIIIRPCDWEKALFVDFQCLPREGKPIISWAKQDEAWRDVVKDLRKLIYDMRQTKPSANTGSSTSSPGQAHEKSYQPLSASSGPVKLLDIPKQAKRGKLWLALALAVFFLILLFTGGLLFLWKNASISTPEETLITFCNALQKQDYQTAYNTYTSGTKQIVSEQAATNDWSTNGQHGKIINCWVKGSETSGDYDHNTVVYLLADGTKIIYYYYLIQENGVWKIINGRGGEKAP